MNENDLHVFSEIGKLKKVLLHRPGPEVENLTPELMERLLFDDIPYLEVARKEHDQFAEVFRECGVEVVYLENLIAETLEDGFIKQNFIHDFIFESGITSQYKYDQLTDYFNQFKNPLDMVEKMMSGIRRESLELTNRHTLDDYIQSAYPFIIDPMPNLYFTRDPFSTIGSGISLNKMRTLTRRRETIFAKYIFKYHHRFCEQNIPFWYDRDFEHVIEGGDELVLSEKVIAIGVSQRTDAAAIDTFARHIFKGDQSFQTILAFDIPKSRAFMHLDTVFTMVDYDKFTIHPEIEDPLTVYSIRKNDCLSVPYTIEKETNTLSEILCKYLELDTVKLMRCGGNKGIDAGREQWSDGSNTLAIAPGEVIVYARNYITNQILEESGVKLHTIESSELSRGRGGPRCMSMPLHREKI